MATKKLKAFYLDSNNRKVEVSLPVSDDLKDGIRNVKSLYIAEGRTTIADYFSKSAKKTLKGFESLENLISPAGTKIDVKNVRAVSPNFRYIVGYNSRRDLFETPVTRDSSIDKIKGKVNIAESFPENAKPGQYFMKEYATERELDTIANSIQDADALMEEGYDTLDSVVEIYGQNPVAKTNSVEPTVIVPAGTSELSNDGNTNASSNPIVSVGESDVEEVKSETKTNELATVTKEEPKKSQPKKIEPRKVKAYVVESLPMLKEPRLPRLKRFGRWIVAHPFISSIIGVTAGAGIALLGAAAVGGGFGAVLGVMNRFIPTVVGGAVLGLGGAAIVGGVASLTTKSRRVRAYNKFMRKVKSVEKAKESTEKLANKLETTHENISKSRDKARKSKGYIKSTFYKGLKKARWFEYRTLKKLHAYKEDKIQKNFGKAIDAKIHLNSLENKHGKSEAIGTYKRRAEKVENRIENAMGDKDAVEYYLDDLKDLNAEIHSLEGNENSDMKLQDVQSGYLTGDSEIVDLSMKMGYDMSDKMAGKSDVSVAEYLSAIEYRNGNKVLVEEDEIIPPTEQELEEARGDEAKLSELIARQRAYEDQQRRINDAAFDNMYQSEDREM